MENSLITSLLQQIQSVTMILREENLNLYEVRFLFDAFIFLFPIMKHYLSSDASIVHSKAFEKAVVGCVSIGFDCLSDEEKTTLKNLKTICPLKNFNKLISCPLKKILFWESTRSPCKTCHPGYEFDLD